MAEPEAREILCLYDSTDGVTAERNEIHLYAEVVLNHLGLVARYRDVNQPLPSDEDMRRYRGVLTWFQDTSMTHGADYWEWIGRQLEAGRRVVILGLLGATVGLRRDVVNEALGKLGLTYGGDETLNPTVLEVTYQDALMDFERGVEGGVGVYLRMKADAKCTVHLRVRRTDMPDSASDLVVTGPRGGFALVPIHYDPYIRRSQWRMDPLAFFERAFGMAGRPRMDLTTAMGRRIFFCHVDGDGFLNGVRQGPNVGRLAGEVIRDEFFRAIDLPATASVIVAELEQGAELWRSILELPNVEAAAHGDLHPLDWEVGTLSYPGSFSLERELEAAVRRLGEISPKPIRVYLWTGACNPPEEAILRIERLGLEHFNGRPSAFDRRYPSVSSYRSATLPCGRALQFNSRAAAENYYTDHWNRNFFAFAGVIETFKRTERPRRLAPINLYYHYYIADQPAGQ
ncbi:MAG: hypothetical protein HY716_01230 [Planctomycetes bacterium]|nr:hypothetical protein [Planctomycetota bacterium]